MTREDLAHKLEVALGLPDRAPDWSADIHVAAMTVYDALRSTPAPADPPQTDGEEMRKARGVTNMSNAAMSGTAVNSLTLERLATDRLIASLRSKLSAAEREAGKWKQWAGFLMRSFRHSRELTHADILARAGMAGVVECDEPKRGKEGTGRVEHPSQEGNAGVATPSVPPDDSAMVEKVMKALQQSDGYTEAAHASISAMREAGYGRVHDWIERCFAAERKLQVAVEALKELRKAYTVNLVRASECGWSLSRITIALREIGEPEGDADTRKDSGAGCTASQESPSSPDKFHAGSPVAEEEFQNGFHVPVPGTLSRTIRVICERLRAGEDRTAVEHDYGLDEGDLDGMVNGPKYDSIAWAREERDDARLRVKALEDQMQATVAEFERKLEARNREIATLKGWCAEMKERIETAKVEGMNEERRLHSIRGDMVFRELKTKLINHLSNWRTFGDKFTRPIDDVERALYPERKFPERRGD